MSEWIEHSGDMSPVPPRTVVESRTRSGVQLGAALADDLCWAQIDSYRIFSQSTQQAAPDFLAAAAKHMADRASTYDKPDGGERSMNAAVTALNAITGRDLSESEGWLLLALLKASRLFSRPAFHRDSAEDLIAYCALLAESKAKE